MRTLPKVIPFDLLPGVMQKLAIAGTATLVLLAGCEGRLVASPLSLSPHFCISLSPSSVSVHAARTDEVERV